MSTKEIAERLVALCRTGAWEQAQNELYDDSVVSIEPGGGPYARVQGKEALKSGKGKRNKKTRVLRNHSRH